MKNEAILKELNDITNRIEVIKKQIEKPKFKQGDWVKLTENYASQLKKDSVFQIVKPQSEDGFCYILDHVAFGIEEYNFLAPYATILLPATPTEVQQALEREAVKRGLNTYKVNCLRGWHKDEHQEFYTDRELKFVFESDKNMLWIDGSCYLSMCIFNNGTWATPIKTMTIDDLAANLSNGNYDEVINYLTENKAQIIETLNNLQNEPTE